MKILTLDFETRSRANLKDVGVWRYSQDPSTRVLCLAYKWHGGECHLWTPDTGPFPQEIVDHVEAGGLVDAHNANFEVAIWLNVLTRHHGVKVVPRPRQWVDTMAVCAQRSLPLKLEHVGEVLRLPVQKDKRGTYLITRLCKPRKPSKKDPSEWCDDYELMLELYSYCKTDTESEEVLRDTIGFLPPDEQRLWTLDHIINVRGIRIDVEAVQAALKIVGYLSQRLEGELRDITGGEVETVGQVDKIGTWCHRQGFSVPNLRAETVEDMLDNADRNGMPADVRRVLSIRQQLARSSTKKFVTMLACVCDDDRIRGLLQYHGAGTGRWAGRLVQPQNFPRGSLEDYAKDLGMSGAEAMELLVSLVKLGKDSPADAAAAIESFFGDPMEALATSLRGMFVPEGRKVFRAADFSAIEAIVTAWLAGETWKLDAFRAIHRGEGYQGSEDMYCAAASKVYAYKVKNKKEHPKERQTGKTCELAFGYQGGVGAWRKFDSSDRYSDEEVDDFKKQWRRGNPEIVRLWYGLEEAAGRALVLNKRVSYRKIAFEPVVDAAGKWLTMILPNGRRLWYYNPKVRVYENAWGNESFDITYEGRDNKRGGKWAVVSTYGGMLTENAVQAVSRDLMVEAMWRVERARYPIILTVHDEIVSEDDPDHGSQEEFEALMSELPTWAPDCPINVSGWCGSRYRKE